MANRLIFASDQVLKLNFFLKLNFIMYIMNDNSALKNNKEHL